MCGMFTLTVTDTETETNTNTDEMGVATNGNLCLPSVSVQREHLHIILHKLFYISIFTGLGLNTP